ncbi:Origin of replication binding protein [uncultured virus]|nr:Origin of replication binding protein [uncultured virus]
MTAAIHDQRSRINPDITGTNSLLSNVIYMDVVEASTPQSLSNNHTEKPVGPSKSLPISTDTNLYTTYNIYFNSTSKYVRGDIPRGSVLVSKDLPPKVDENGRSYVPKSFALVPDVVDLFHFVTRTDIPNRNFYEVIEEYMDQKPRFDLDFSYDKFPNITRETAYFYLQQALDSVNIVMLRHNVQYSFKNNCLVFNSHGFDNKNHYKYSFHIVIDKLAHQGNKDKENEAKAFYRLVLNELPDNIRNLGFLDSAVYSSFQNFRLLWCQKKDSGRPKILDPITEYVPHFLYDPKDSDKLNAKRKDLGLFLASLVSFSSESQYLPSFISEVEIKDKEIRRNKSVNCEINDGQYNVMIEIFEKQIYSNQYVIGSETQDTIFLNRKCPGLCPVHNRIHNGIGAFLKLDKYQNIWFNCFRQDNGIAQRGIRIGNCYNMNSTAIDVVQEAEDVADNNQKEGFYVGEEFISPTNTLDLENKDRPGIITPINETANILADPITEFTTINILDMMNDPNLWEKNEQNDGLPPYKTSDLSSTPNIMGSTDIISDNNIINNKHVAEYNNNNNILCVNNRQLQSSFELPKLNGVFSIKNFIDEFLEKDQDNFVFVKDLFRSYVGVCNIRERPLEVSNQTLFTKEFMKYHNVSQKRSQNRRENAILNVKLRTLDTIQQSFDKANIASKESTNNRLPLSDKTVPLDPLQQYIRSNIIDWTNGYVACKRLYSDWCKHRDSIQQTIIYNSQKAFTIDLSKKYKYTIVQKYIDGKKKSCIRGFIHREDEAREKLKKDMKDSIHKRKINRIITGAIICEDKVVRKINEMIENKAQYILAIKAACAMEKTTRIIEHIFENADTLKRILFITNRVSLADEHKQQLESLGFKIYYDKKKRLIDDERVICQIDSSYKIISAKPYDLVVMDEFNSTLSHLVTFCKKKQAVNSIFEELIRNIPRIIVSDALLDNRYLQYISMLGRDDLITYQYTHQPHINKRYSMIENKAELVRLICEDLRKGRRVVVPTNIESLATSLAEMIRRDMPDIRIGLYTGKNKVKRIGSLLDEWRELQVLIYTPTITCGISFTENLFDTIYGYFNTSSCSPSLALQMLFRCRAVNRMRICIEKGPKSDLVCRNPNVVTLNDYKKYVVRNYDGAGGQELFERSYLRGQINTNTAYFHMYCIVHQDICEGYKNYESYLSCFLRETGVQYIEDDYEQEEIIEDNAKCEIQDNIKERLNTINVQNQLEDENGISAAPYITGEMLRSIQKKDDKTIDEVRVLKKMNICKEYEIKWFDPLFGCEARKLMRVHRNTKIFYDASRYQYGSDEYRIEIQKAMQKTIDTRIDVADFIFEGDKLTEVQRVYQAHLCEITLFIIHLLKIDNNDNPFERLIPIKYNIEVEEYIKSCREFIEGYFREDMLIFSWYNKKEYKYIIQRILDRAFGLMIDFEENSLESRFKLVNESKTSSPVNKFYLKIGEYSNADMTFPIYGIDEIDKIIGETSKRTRDMTEEILILSNKRTKIDIN